MLEERKKQRLKDLMSTIAAADALDSILFKWGTPLYILCRAMQKLHDGAFFFYITSAFVTIQGAEGSRTRQVSGIPYESRVWPF